MGQAEYDRGLTICRAYVERVCRCAGKDPRLKEQCELAQAQPEALDTIGKVFEQKVSVRERQLSEAQARKVVAACLNADGQLDPTTCPRVAAAP